MLYTLYLNFKSRIKEYTLPSCNNRKINIDISSMLGINECSLELEVIDDTWRMLSNEIVLVSDVDGSTEVILDDDKTITANIRKTTISFAILVVAITENIYSFRKYELIDTVKIGNNINAEINISDKLVSQKHAVIMKKENSYFVADFSKNGVYINSKRVQNEYELEMFDVIYIFGTKIIFLGYTIAVNNSDKTKISLKEAEYSDDGYISEAAEEEVATGSPRRREMPDESLIDIRFFLPDNSSENKKYDITDFLKLVMPSAAVLSAAVNLKQKSDNILWLLCGFAALTASGGMLMHMYNMLSQRISHNKIAALSDRKAELFIEEKEKEIADRYEKYKSMINSQFRRADELTGILDTESSYLWNRNKNDDDFLKIRLGCGKSDMGKLFIRDYDDMADSNDKCRRLTDELYEKNRFIDDIVISADLADDKIFGLIGENKKIYETAACMVVQVASLHRCNDVRIMFFYTEAENEYFSWIRWLPHTFSSDKKQRYTACSEGAYKNILFIISNELSRRTDQRSDGYKGSFYPHYVVFCSSDKIFRNETISKYINSPEELGVTFILMYGQAEKLPNKCNVIISTNENDEGIYRLDKIRNRTETLTFDEISFAAADKFARRLISLAEEEGTDFSLPDSISFFEMLSVTHPYQSDILRKYKVNRAYEGICAYIGISEDGMPFCLDIHEKKHGPHGLVAGTTGSGKSEVLQTMIISMAMSYHPDEISFVIIDYKGGGMSDIFEKLPHTAGIVTNLSDSSENGFNQARRALISIKSEIRRRQKIFKSYKLNHIDSYMKLFRDGKTSEPMPHVIIIVDEFAELKREQPDFINQLVSTARIGRSLGMHLILATQKPAGIVDDEIWSNSRFRICLRVQDKSDSMGMLRRPEAASLTVTGRAYVQIGNDELFDMVQTAYSGESYDSHEKQLQRRTYMIDTDGTESVICMSPQNSSAELTQLDAMTEYIVKVCDENNIHLTRKIWLDPLPSVLNLDDAMKYGNVDFSSGLICVTGAVDDPENQDIRPAVINIQESDNIIIAGNTGSGKTTLIKTMLYSLSENYSPDMVSMSLFDFAGGSFDIYGGLPHFTEVISSVTEEIAEHFFNRTFAEIERRKKIFADSSVACYREYAELGNTMPSWLIFFDGYYLFREIYPEHDDDFMRLSRDCVKYGIHIIISVKQISDIKFRTRQNFKTIIPLQLNDHTEYTDIFGVRTEFDTPGCAGRGFIKNERILEFQTAVIYNENSDQNKAEQIKEKINLILKKYDSSLKKKSKYPVDNILYENSFCFFLKNISFAEYTELIGRVTNYSSDVFLWSYDKTGNGQNIYHETTTEFTGTDGAYQMLLRLKKEFSSRNEEMKKCGVCTKSDIVVIIRSMDSFCKCIYDDTYKENMSAITEIFLKNGSGLGIRFISDIDENSKYAASEAVKIFMSYNTGVEYA